MNLSRLLLLLSLIAAAMLLAMNQLAPPIFERQTRDVLFSRLDAEIRYLEQRERSAALQRELVATQIADSGQLRRMLDAGPDASRPISESFAGIAQAAIDRNRVPFHTVTLIGPSGQVLTPSPQRGVLTTEELVAGAHAPLALERRTPVHHVFAITGRLFESIAVPVPGPVGDVLGAVVLIQEVSGATAAERRTGASTDIAYFAQLEIIADTLPGAPMRERALALVRRTNEGNIGRGGRIQLAETERFRPPPVDGSSTQQADRMELMAPMALLVSNVDDTIEAEYGAVVIVEAEWPPDSLAAFLINGHAFDDGTMVLWSFIAAALGLFFLGIILDDAVRSRLMNRLAATVEVIAQSNHPQPISESSYPSIYRPMVRAVNALMEEYRSRASAARRAREEADEANRRVDQVTGNVPDVSKLILGDEEAEPLTDSAAGSGAFSAALSESEATSDTIEFMAPRPSAPSAPVEPVASADGSDADVSAGESAGLANARTDAMPAVSDSELAKVSAGRTLRHTPPPLPVAARASASESGTIGMMAASAVQAPSPPLAEEEINPDEFDFVSSSINQAAAEFLTESGADDDSGLTALATDHSGDGETDESPTTSETARFFNDLDSDSPVPSDFAEPQPISMELIGSDSVPETAAESESSAPPTVRPSPLRAPLTPTTARPMMSRTSPMSSLPDPATLSSELPAQGSDERFGRPAATTDVAVQAVVSTTESSGVSALIDSIIAQRPSGSPQASPSGSWPPSHVDENEPEDPNAITSPPPFGEELSRASVEPAVSRDFGRGGSNAPTNPAIQTVGMTPTDRAAASTPPESIAPERPAASSGTLHAIQSGALAAALAEDDVHSEGLDASAPGEQMAAATRVEASPTQAPEEADMPSEPPARPLRTMAMTPAAALMPADLDEEPSPELLDAFEKMGLSPSKIGIRTIGQDSDAGRTENSALIHAEDLIARAEEKLARLSSTAEETFLLFDEFTKARAQCGESTSELTFSKFTRKLERSREQLKERYQAERVDFSVAIVDGKATLKARPVRD
jgi:hypothetical protein